MKILNKFKKLSFFLVMLIFTTGSIFAQTYVSATDGDDGVAGDGTLSKPYATITKALANTAAAGTIVVEPGTYVAATTTVTTALTIRAEDFGSNGGTAVIINDLVLNMATATDILSFGETGMPFNIDNLTLTEGVMNIATANVVIATGSQITRTAGSINNAPTTTNVDVDYDGTNDIASGPELPADLGTGALTVNITAGKVLTVGAAVEAATVTVTTGNVNFSDVTSAGAVAIAAGDVSFANLTSGGDVVVTAGNTSVTGTLLLNQVIVQNNGTGDVTLNNVTIALTADLASTIDNTSTGDIAVNGILTYTHNGSAAAAFDTDIDNGATGTITIANAIVRPASGGVNTGQFVEVTVLQPAAGTIDLAGGTIEVLTNAGTVDFNADMTIAGSIGNSGTMMVNANTLTCASTIFAGGGDVISATAGIVGSGSIIFTNAISVNQAELPNVIVNGAAGKLTMAANINVFGDFTLASPVAGALTDAGFDLGVNGNFTRTDNTLGNVVATGTLSMDGAGDAVLTAGTQLTLNSVDINKDALATKVTLSASLRIDNDFTITSGTVVNETYHIRMLGGGTFTNGSGGYNPDSDPGYLIIEGNTNLDGASVYSNMDIRGTSTATVTAAILKFSGLLHITDGILAVGANTFTFVDDLVITPDVFIHTDGPGTMTGGTVNTESATVFYNLTYTGVGNATAGAEWIAAGIKDLNISTGGAVPAANTITSIAANTTIVGGLTVDSKQILQLDNAGARDLTLDGDSPVAHSVVGKVTSTLGTGKIIVTGNATSITGSTSTTADAELPNLDVTITAAESFSSTNIKKIAGDLTVADGSVDIDMNTTTATITGDVTLTDGALDLNMASTTSTHGGDLVVTDGNLIYTRGSAAAQQVIGGSVTLTDGTLTLGSDVSVTDETTQVAGDLILGANDYTQKGSAATPDYNRTGAGTITGTGLVVLDATVAALDLAPGATLTIPNLAFVDGGGNGIILNAAFEVTNSLTHTSGAVNYSNLTFSGNTYLYEAGTITGAFTLEGSAVIATFEASVAIPTLTIDSPGSVEFKSNSSTARTITVGTAFTQTKGNLALGINTLDVTAAFTNTAGNITQTTGYLVLNVVAPAVADGFTIDNLFVTTSAANFGTKTFTVVKNLKFNANIITSADDKLVLGDGVTITRTAGALSNVPTFGTSTNLVYDGASPITAAKEQPATVNNYTIIGGATDVTLADDVTVTGTLSIAGILTHSTANRCTMANGSTLELKVVGTTAIVGEDLIKAGSMDLIYATAMVTSTRELGTVASNAYSTFTGNVTVQGDLTLVADVTIDGKLTLDGGDVVMAAAAAGDMITLLGDFEEKGGEWFITNPGTVVLGGANDAEFKLSAAHTIDANSKITLNKTNANSVVTLKGGNLTFPSTQPLTLTNGVFDTDGASKIILVQSTIGGQPTQGYTRTSGVIAGNISKFIDRATTIDISQVEYPTGDTEGNYRPAVFYFKTAPQSSINLLVNHDATTPGGTNQLPMTLSSQTITNYPDLNWFVQSDIPLAPSYEYDVEFQAKGYTDYLDDGIENVRLIRRDSGNVANPWRLQGGVENNGVWTDGLYDNSTIAADHPLVKVINAGGGLTSQGSKFTYSQANKPPVVAKTATVNSVAAPIVANAITIAEGTDTLVVDYTVTDPDIGDAATTTAVVPVGAEWDADASTVTWTPDYTQAGDHLVIITATDTYSQSTIDTLTITVTNSNQIPNWTAVPADTIQVGEGQAYTFQLEATDGDGDTLTYSNVPNAPAPDSVTVVDSTGLLTITPDFGEVGNIYDITVRVDDSNGGVVDSTFVVEVVKMNRIPTFVNEMPDTTIDEGQALTFTYTATDLDADTLIFTLGDAAPAGATIDSTTGVFAWTPGYTEAGVHTFNAIVTDDGSPNMSDSSEVTITVADKNAPPTWVTVLPDTTIFVGDKLTFTYFAKDMDMDPLTFALDVPNPQTLSIVAQDGISATIEWTPVVTDTALYIIGMNVTDGITSINTTAKVLVKVTTVDISGIVAYNVSTELLDAVTVTLSNGTDTWTDTTDADGVYEFTGVISGEYALSAVKTDQVGGALASDALETQLYVVNPDSTFLVTDLQMVAADVVGVGTITSSDALAILNRSVGINDFQVADWLFDGATVTVGTQDLVQNLTGIAAGDARSDYSPGTGLAKASNIAVNSDEVLNIKKESEFELPISISELAEIGSYTFKLKYDVEKVEFLGVSTENGGTLVANVVEDVISIAWVNMDSKNIKVKDGAALATLRFKATKLFSKEAELSLELLDGAEITDRMAKSFNAGIKIPVVAIGIPDIFALRQNYPNPFNPSTTIQYDLPENGKVTLTVYNSLGQRVGTLVNTKQVAGAYEVNFNASNLASGVYLYRVTVEGSKNFVMTKKMILMK